MSTLDDPIFHDEAAARAHLEALRWPDGVVCPHCGGVECATRLNGQSHRPGLFQCNACREHFTVTVGTVMERSHIPLHKWVLAFRLMAASKKGVSAHQLHRTLGIGYKSAWFLVHRVREAMREGDLAPMGQSGGIVEADETFIGHRKGAPVRAGVGHKMKVLSLLDRDTGAKRSMVLNNMKPSTIADIVIANIAKEAVLMTDEAGHYMQPGKTFAGHLTVNHGTGEYVSRTDPTIHTNTIEGSFAIFKRGMRGIYQHCGEQHLHRYLAEFDFRYSNRVALGVDDTERASLAAKGGFGRRLMYKPAREGAA